MNYDFLWNSEIDKHNDPRSISLQFVSIQKFIEIIKLNSIQLNGLFFNLVYDAGFKSKMIMKLRGYTKCQHLERSSLWKEIMHPHSTSTYYNHFDGFEYVFGICPFT